MSRRRGRPPCVLLASPSFVRQRKHGKQPYTPRNTPQFHNTILVNIFCSLCLWNDSICDHTKISPIPIGCLFRPKILCANRVRGASHRSDEQYTWGIIYILLLGHCNLIVLFIERSRLLINRGGVQWEAQAKWSETICCKRIRAGQLIQRLFSCSDYNERA